MVEILLQFLGELALQFLGEVLVELGLHSLSEPFRRVPDPWVASLGYLLLGCACGGTSLLFVGHHIIATGATRVANLVLTPVVLGAVMSVAGMWRARRGDPILRIDRFFYGYLFALGFALVRFYFAQ